MTESNFVHGVRRIAQVLNKSERSVYHLLETGRLPGSFKLNGGWSLDLEMFRAGVAELQQQARARQTIAAE